MTRAKGWSQEDTCPLYRKQVLSAREYKCGVLKFHAYSDIMSTRDVLMVSKQCPCSGLNV